MSPPFSSQVLSFVFSFHFFKSIIQCSWQHRICAKATKSGLRGHHDQRISGTELLKTSLIFFGILYRFVFEYYSRYSKNLSGCFLPALLCKAYSMSLNANISVYSIFCIFSVPHNNVVSLYQCISWNPPQYCVTRSRINVYSEPHTTIWYRSPTSMIFLCPATHFDILTFWAHNKNVRTLCILCIIWAQ